MALLWFLSYRRSKYLQSKGLLDILSLNENFTKADMRKAALAIAQYSLTRSAFFTFLIYCLGEKQDQVVTAGGLAPLILMVEKGDSIVKKNSLGALANLSTHGTFGILVINKRNMLQIF